jgi:hypothetical protein
MRLLPPSPVHREAVEQPDLPVVRDERGLQDEGALEVAARGPGLGRRGDPAVPSPLDVQQAPEHAPGIEPGHAAPVHRAGPRDQGPGVAVGHEAVVGDRRVGIGQRVLR